MTWVSVTRPWRGTRPDGGMLSRPSVVVEQLALLELLLRELLQLRDGARHLGGVSRGEADHVLAVAVLLLQADVADVRDLDLDVRLAFDNHGRHRRPGRLPGLRRRRASNGLR